MLRRLLNRKEANPKPNRILSHNFSDVVPYLVHIFNAKQSGFVWRCSRMPLFCRGERRLFNSLCSTSAVVSYLQDQNLIHTKSWRRRDDLRLPFIICIINFCTFLLFFCFFRLAQWCLDSFFNSLLGYEVALEIQGIVSSIGFFCMCYICLGHPFPH